MMFDIKNSKNVVLDDNKNAGSDFAKIENVENFSARNNVSEAARILEVSGWRKLISSTLFQLFTAFLVLVITYLIYKYFPNIKDVMT